MPIRELSPADAQAAMSAAPGHVFVDVRTVEEYEGGHPAGTINVPWALRDPASGGMSPNPEFVAVMRKHVPPGTPVFASCQAGVRSLNACRALEQAGYTQLVSVAGGWGGKRDPATGAIVAPGWKDAGLPTALGPSDYARLRA